MTIDPSAFWIGDTPLMPDNAYSAFFENIATPDMQMFDALTSVNMPWWFNIDEDCYDSQSIIQREMLALFGWRSQAHYPRVYLNFKAEDKNEMAYRFNAQHQIYESWQNKYWHDIQTPAMKRMLSAREVQDSDMALMAGFSDEVSISNTKPSLDFHRFTVENKGDWGRRVIRRAEQQVGVILAHGNRILRDYASQTGWDFELRHPVAFGGTHAESLINSRVPISHMDHVAPLSVRLMFDKLLSYDFVHVVSDYRNIFDSWANLNCTAAFSSNEVNDTIYALTPLGFPAPLVKTPDHRLPLTILTHPTQSILDQWQRIEYLNHAEVQKGEIYSANINTTVVDPAILNLGWLVAAAATILSAGLNVGQGNRKLSWLHSNINAALVDHAMKIAPVILKQAEAVTRHD